MIAQRTKDRLREMLFPLTIVAIVGSLYAMAMAQSVEAQVRRESIPNSSPAETFASISEVE